MYDLVLTNGRILDPSQGLDEEGDVAFRDGKIAAFGRSLSRDGSSKTVDVSGAIVVPGLIDMHTHAYWGGTSIGVEANAYARSSGLTTLVDAGSAGPGNFPGFRSHVIAKSDVRILAFLHASFAGIFAFSKQTMVGESEDIRLLAPSEALAVAEANRDVIVGIKVRVGRFSSGSSGLHPLDMAIQIAEQAEMPVMAHIDHPPPSYEEVLARLRPGDILTHAFRPFPNSPLDGRGMIRKEVWRARERGVLFDIGHGFGSLSFQVARSMLEEGFLPDTISSDVHTLCIDGPVFDQLTTMSKFLNLDMSLEEVIASSTANAALALNRPELGTFKIKAEGDATILKLVNGSFDFVDSTGEVLKGHCRLESEGVVFGGEWRPTEASLDDV